MGGCFHGGRNTASHDIVFRKLDGIVVGAFDFVYGVAEITIHSLEVLGKLFKVESVGGFAEGYGFVNR